MLQVSELGFHLREIPVQALMHTLCAQAFDTVQEVPFIRARTLRNQGRRFQHLYQWEDASFTKFQAGLDPPVWICYKCFSR